MVDHLLASRSSFLFGVARWASDLRRQGGHPCHSPWNGRGDAPPLSSAPRRPRAIQETVRPDPQPFESTRNPFEYLESPEIEPGAVTRRRLAAVMAAVCPLVMLGWPAAPVLAEDGGGSAQGGGVLESVLTLMDQDEVAGSGARVPKAYRRSAREVVRTLRESLESLTAGDINEARKKAVPAKAAIRVYIVDWRGRSEVVAEESYKALEDVLRELGEFYSKRGPAAILPSDLRDKLLAELEVADTSL